MIHSRRSWPGSWRRRSLGGRRRLIRVFGAGGGYLGGAVEGMCC